MRISRLTLLAIAGVALAARAIPTAAHEQWIDPSDYRLQRGAAVSMNVRVGEGLCGAALPWQPGRAVRFVASAARPLDFAPFAAAGDTTWARFSPTDDEGVMVGWESNFVPHQMPAAKFEAYLADEGLDGPLKTRHAAHDTTNGRERYRRCTKAWLTGAGGMDAGLARATRPLGFPLEIVPRTVPGADSTLTLDVTFEGAPLAGVLVRVWRASFAHGTTPAFCGDARGPAEIWAGRTDARGAVSLPCPDSGQWLVGIVHMVPSRDRDEADWESTWASLSFARTGVPSRP